MQAVKQRLNFGRKRIPALLLSAIVLVGSTNGSMIASAQTAKGATKSPPAVAVIKAFDGTISCSLLYPRLITCLSSKSGIVIAARLFQEKKVIEQQSYVQIF